MPLLIELTIVLNGLLSHANIRFLREIISSFYCVQKDITTKSLSRYSEYSVRTFFRFLKTEWIDWLSIRVKIFRFFVFAPTRTYILAVDETVEGKSRKKSYGISRFYSSIADKAINGICLFGFSLIETESRHSYFINVEQVVYTEEDRARIKAERAKKKEAAARNKKGEAKTKGRKKGTKNKPKVENPTASFRAFKKGFNALTTAFKECFQNINVPYLVADSAYGSKDYIEQVQGQGIHFISKMYHNAALYVPKPKKRGQGITAGEKFDLYNLADSYLKEQTEDDEFTYKTYQIQALSLSVKGHLLNVVVELAIPKASGKKIGIRILFSTDLELSHTLMKDYYSLRFQIEFDFRDAKQHFGLSSFKNYKKENLTNFVNLCFFMCLVNKILLKQFRNQCQNENLNTMDLKILFSYRYIAKDVINRARKSPESIFMKGFCDTLIPETLINCE